MIIVLNDGKMTTIKNGNQLTGDKIPGDLDGWNYFGTDPNNLLTLSYGVLSSRSTTLYHTHPPVSAAINKTCTYAVGPGLFFRSQPDWETLGVTKEVAKDWGIKFQRLIHYYFLLLNFYEKQQLIFRTADIMGDSLLMFDRAGMDDGMPFDLIETGGDQIDWKQTRDQSGEKLAATLGITHDDFLRKKGVILENGTAVDFRDKNGDQNLIQYMNKKMARQLRGMPLAYKIIALSKNNDRWWDAMLQRAVMETIIMGYKQGGNVSDLPAQMDDLASKVTGSTTSEDGVTAEAGMKKLGAANIFSFNKDENMQFTDLKTPSNNFDKMQTAYIEMVGMATDVPAEVLMSKYSTSFTAHKGALNDFVKFYMAKRNTLIKTCNNVVVREIAKFIFLSGQMKPLDDSFFTNPITQMATLAGNWLGPTPGHINPKQEVDAKVVEVTNAFITRSQAAAAYGNEYDNMIEEWGENEKEWAEKTPAAKAETMQTQEDELNNADDDSDTDDDNNGGDE